MAQEFLRSIEKPVNNPRNRTLLLGILAFGLGVTACRDYQAPPPIPILPTYPPIEHILTQVALGTPTPTMAPLLDRFVSIASAQELLEPTPTITVGTPTITVPPTPRTLVSTAYGANIAREDGTYTNGATVSLTRTVVSTPARMATPTPRAYIPGQPPQCPDITDSAAINNFLGIETNPRRTMVYHAERRFFLWAPTSLGSPTAHVIFAYGPSLTREVPIGTMINGQYAGTVVIERGATFSCYLGGDDPFNPRIGP